MRWPPGFFAHAQNDKMEVICLSSPDELKERHIRITIYCHSSNGIMGLTAHSLF